LTIAIAGAPNTGKSTVFNELTGSHQSIGNFPGVTVEARAGRLKVCGKSAIAIDLPGTYSLTAFSQEELVARKFLLDTAPDLVVDILDAGNLDRNLFLTVQLMELGVPLVICLNMMDRAEADGIRIDCDLMSRLLGVPVVPTSARNGKGLRELQSVISEHAGKIEQRAIKIDYGRHANAEIETIAETLAGDPAFSGPRARWAAVKLLEGDREVELAVKHHANSKAVLSALEESRKRLRVALGEGYEVTLAQRRYGFISGIVRQVLKKVRRDVKSLSDRLDNFLTHPIAGIPIFLAVMWALFTGVFVAAEPFVGWIETAFGWLSGALAGRFGGGLLESLAVDGVIGGVGAVLVFVPNIFFLFAGIALLEDSGYLARAAFIMERIMSRIGLPGKAFVPIIMGFGCNVPAIMATRVLEDRRDRLISILVIPLVTCSARLPVYLLLIGAFFPAKIAGGILWSIYIASAIFTLGLAKLIRTLLFKGATSPMILELPPYLAPTLRGVVTHAWMNTRHYIKKAFTFILVGAVLVWYAMNFPVTVTKSETEAGAAAIAAMYDARIASAAETEVASLEAARDAEIAALETNNAHVNLNNSIAGKIGHWLEPALSPLGFDWRIGIALIGGVLAKEIVVSTMGVIFNVADNGKGGEGLRSALREATLPSGAKAYTPLSMLSLVLFVLLYIPCVATLAVQRKELSSGKWFLFAATYTTVLAYGVSLAFYQGGKLLGFN